MKLNSRAAACRASPCSVGEEGLAGLGRRGGEGEIGGTLAVIGRSACHSMPPRPPVGCCLRPYHSISSVLPFRHAAAVVFPCTVKGSFARLPPPGKKVPAYSTRSRCSSHFYEATPTPLSFHIVLSLFWGIHGEKSVLGGYARVLCN